MVRNSSQKDGLLAQSADHLLKHKIRPMPKDGVRPAVMKGAGSWMGLNLFSKLCHLAKIFNYRSPYWRVRYADGDGEEQNERKMQKARGSKIRQLVLR